MMDRRWRLLVPFLVAGLLVASCTADDEADPPPPEAEEEEFPRHETLYTSGNAYDSPSDWNPVKTSGQATGVRGLLYETLFLLDPWTAELEPWLAERGEWVSGDEYVLTLRQGMQWSDGEPLTAADVVFTVDLGRIPDVPYASVFSWLATATAEDDHTVRFTFTDPRHGEWDQFLYRTSIVPEHIWGTVADAEVMAATGEDMWVGSGPYRYHSHDRDQIAWERVESWWGTEHLGLEMAPRYVIDRVNPSSAESALEQLVNGELDLSNHFLPGIGAAPELGDTITTYFDGPPYMLPANTVYLLPNNTRPPLDDPAFRRAIAFSVDVEAIIDTVYDGAMAPADPTGLPALWVDQAVVAQHGYQYDPAQAKQILAGAGYADGNGDGLVQAPGGGPISLRMIVPSGFVDWEQATDLVVDNLREAGIDAVRDTEIVGVDSRGEGGYDLTLHTIGEPPSAPWVVYRYLFQLPVADFQRRDNVHRHENPSAWDLTQELVQTSVDDPRFARTLTQLQEAALVEMPAIPLWHNGLWSQASNAVWTNWPSAAPDTPNHYPTTVTGMWERGAIYLLAELEPVATGGAG